MPNLKDLKVLSSNVTTNNSYCNKLVAKTEIRQATVFGDAVSSKQETYYLFTETQNAVNTVGKLDLDAFNLVEKPFTITKEDGTLEEVMLKYLYPKI